MSRMLPYERRDRDIWGVGFGEELFSDSLQACFRHQCGSFVPASILRPCELSGSRHPAHSCIGALAMSKEVPCTHFTHKETGCHRGTAFSVTTCLAEGKAGTHGACHPTSGSSLRKQPLCQSRRASRFPFCDFQCPRLGRDSSLGFEGQPGPEEQ